MVESFGWYPVLSDVGEASTGNNPQIADSFDLVSTCTSLMISAGKFELGVDVVCQRVLHM